MVGELISILHKHNGRMQVSELIQEISESNYFGTHETDLDYSINTLNNLISLQIISVQLGWVSVTNNVAFDVIVKIMEDEKNEMHDKFNTRYM